MDTGQCVKDLDDHSMDIDDTASGTDLTSPELSKLPAFPLRKNESSNMSRRKQSKPRSFKRDLDDPEEDGGVSMTTSVSMETDVSSNTSFQDEQPLPGPSLAAVVPPTGNSSDKSPKETGDGEVSKGITMATGEEEEGEEEYRCEMCNTIFTSLTQFMDHRNFDCTAGCDGLLDWRLHMGSPTPSRTPSPCSSSEEGAAKSPLLLHDGPDSPTVAGLAVDQIPYSVGADEASPYACQFCEKAFAKLSFLKKHEQVHSDQLPYKCEFCCRCFKHKRSRDRHVKLHTGDKKYKCCDCGSAFSRSDHLKIHLKTHENGKPYQCPSCSRGYTTVAALTSHLLSHKPDCGGSMNVGDHEDKSCSESETEARLSCEFICPQCSTKCVSIEEFQIHMQTHSEELAGAKGSISGAGIRRVLDKDATLNCPYCTEVFIEEDVLEMHIEQLHTTDSMNKCVLCSLCFLDPDDLTLHLKSHENLNLLKELAPAAKKKSFLQVETMTVTSSSGSPSSSSSSSLSSSSSSVAATAVVGDVAAVGRYRESSKSKESGSVKLDCPYCSRKSFTTMGQLNVHIRTMHTGITDHLFSCHICQVGFASSSRLVDHMRREHPDLVHPDKLEIKFPCDYCTFEFNSADVLKQHKEAVHKVSELACKQVDVVYCSQCTMVFPHIYALAEHMHHVHGYNKMARSSPVATPTKMSPEKYAELTSPRSDGGGGNKRASTPKDYPTKSLTPNGTLTSGASVIQNESYLCDHCNATFHDLSSYQVHIKNHVESSFAKYSCSECQAEFTSEEQLETHVFVHFLVLTTEYGCTSCLKLFSKPDELQKHLMDIHAHHLYRCSLCKEVFDSKVNIQVHFAIKHSNECKLYKCSTCGSVFRSEMEWQLHVKVHHLGVSKPYRCFFCKESFGSETDLQAHLATHQKQFPCPLCDEAFHVEYMLDKHLQAKHSPDGQQQQQQQQQQKQQQQQQQQAIQGQIEGQMQGHLSGQGSVKVKIEITESSPIATLPPPDVQLTYHSPPVAKGRGLSKAQHSPSGHTTAHKARPRNGTPPLSSSAASTIAMATALMPKKGDLNYKCEICDVKFSDEGTLQKHRIHDHSISPEMQLVLQKNHANKQAALSSLAASPKNSQASDKFSQLCVYCNQTFKTKGELEKHMKTHVTPSNQKCNICDEVFPSASILAEHKLTHCKVVKGNVCVICKVGMKSEEQFYSHSQQHGFQGTNMQCVVCRQTLASMLELQMHGRHHFQNPANFYTCCVCLKTFDSKENLISKLNTNGRSYYVCKPCYHGETAGAMAVDMLTCSTCGLKFDSQVQLDGHMIQHRKTFQCIKCQQSFASEYEIQLHVATHVIQEGNVHECKICSRIFESPAKLQSHLIQHTFEGTEIKCYVCHTLFTTPAAIQMHVLEHGMGARRFACTQCPQKFFFSAELQNHMYIHALYPKATISTAVSSGGSSGGEGKLHKYQCSECAKTFASAAALGTHRKSHRKDNPLGCSLCTESFDTMVDLQQHFFLLHSGLESIDRVEKQKPVGSPQRCMECQREFPSISSLQGHMRVHTSGPNSCHSCPECGKEFGVSKELTHHLKAQHGQKPYECPVCHKRFSRKENRKAHMKSHTGSKPYVCPVCVRSFTRRCHVKEHMKVHFTQPSTYTCDFCGEMYSRSKHLRRHLVVVHNRTPDFVCKLCSQPFASMKDLRTHLTLLHSIDDDLMDALSVDEEVPAGQLSTNPGQDVDMDDDVSDSQGDSHTHNGGVGGCGVGGGGGEGFGIIDRELSAIRESANDMRAEMALMEQQRASQEALVKLEGNVSIVTNPPEQVTVN